jgi:hypothetical protein
MGSGAKPQEAGVSQGRETVAGPLRLITPTPSAFGARESDGSSHDSADENRPWTLTLDDEMAQDCFVSSAWKSQGLGLDETKR